MPNIIGEGFSKYVLDQIEMRESKLGAAVRDEENVAWQFGRTSWVKMASGVDIKDLTRFNQTALGGLTAKEIGDARLAKKFVLFNGTSDEGKNIQRSGLYRLDDVIKENPLNEAAYGLGGLEFGLRPMPGIQSVNITSGPRGSLRFAEVKMKAWNRAQFEIIDTLYLRLGFTVLVEWGHSNYFDNNGKYQGDNKCSIVDDFLEGKALQTYSEYGIIKGQELGQYEVLSLIRAKRQESDGNYDALYGKISNFSWNYQKDGSYEITVKVVSMGDVIESLKINSLAAGQNLDKVPSELERFKTLNKLQQESAAINALQVTKGRVLTAEELKTAVADYTKILEEAQAKKDEEQQKLLETSAGVIKSYKDKHDIGAMLYQVQQNLESVGQVGRGMSRKYYGVSGKADAIKQIWSGKDATYYIRLGSFLQWYQLTKMVVVKKGNPLVKIDFDTDSNFMFFANYQASADPRICMVSLTYNLSTGGSLDIFKFGEPFLEAAGGPGKIMNIYLNFEFILQTLDNVIDENGKVPVLAFFEGLCSGINSALGNVNKLSVVVDEETNIIRFIDEVPLPQRDDLLKKQNRSTQQGLFSLYGFRQVGKETRGTFVTDFNIQTELSKETAAMISIGAQANGKVVGEDATAFSAWNSGLIDRIEPTKLDPNANADDSPETLFKDAWKNYFSFLNDMGTVNAELPVWNEQNMDTYTSFMSTMLQYNEALNAVKQKKASPTIGFLPVNLSLTMDGLSGMKVYQKFSVDSTFLPSNYPTSLQFIIKTIGHTIQNNKWETKIESLVVPTSVSKTGEEKPAGRDSRQEERGSPSSNSSNTLREYKAPPGTQCGVVKKTDTNKKTIVERVIQYLEGGYYNPVFHYHGSDPRYAASGETMFGIDRKAGLPESKYVRSANFWNEVDRLRGGLRWKWNFIPDEPVRSKLIGLAADYILPSFERSFNSYVGTHPVRRVIESDGRLLFHFVYAQYNGPAWLKGWAKLAKQSYDAGTTSSDGLLTILLDDRSSGGYQAYKLGTGKNLGKQSASLIAQGGAKIKKLVGIGC